MFVLPIKWGKGGIYMAKARAVSGQMDLISLLTGVYTKTMESLIAETPKQVTVIPCETPAASTVSEEILSKIHYYGKNKSSREQTKQVVESLPLTGIEPKDRLIIQKALDSHKGMAFVSYDGNSVYPSQKLVKELLRMKKTESIEKMSNDMYKFLSLNFDIAHYDKSGFISYYDGSWPQFFEETLSYSMKRIPAWETDVKQILLDAGLLDNAA